MKTEDLMRCEEQLRNTLHCDDKEKLRRKLAQLQREYLRTAQRLQRAERLDAVKKHVRSRITQQNQREPDDQPGPSSLVLNNSDAAALGPPQSQPHSEDASDAENCKRTNTIRFLLPSDAASPHTSDPDHPAQSGHTSSSALGLRSRRSRLRLKERSAEAGGSAKDFERGREPKVDTLKSADDAGEQQEEPRLEETEVIDRSEELLSCGDSEFPSLLLTHWNSVGSKKNESGSASLHSSSEKTPRKETEKKEEEVARPSEKSSDEEAEQNTAERTERDRNPDDCVIEKEETSNAEASKPPSLLDSCTLVEGLLFPVEYYVRTTRRMASSHSQPDMQAVILSQLSAGRHRRSRGLSRRSTEPSQSDTQTGFASETVDTPTSSLNTSDERDQKIGENSDATRIDLNAGFPEGATAGRPIRGRKRRTRRERGRGRPHTPRPSNSPSEGSTLCLTAVETAALPDEAQPTSRNYTDSQLSPGVSEAPSSSDQPKMVFPIFKKSIVTRSQESRGTSSLRSLLLPSSPLATGSLLPLPSLSPLLTVKGLPVSSLQQDFHLPDEQFASLKLLKLRQVVVDSGVERFSSPSPNTRSSFCDEGSSDQSTLHPVPLTLTPTISNSSSPDEEQSAPESTQLPDLSVDQKDADKLIGQTEGDEREADEEHRENHPAEIHHNSTLLGGQASAGEDFCFDTNVEDQTVALQTTVRCDRAADKVSDSLDEHRIVEKQTDCCEDDERCVNDGEDRPLLAAQEGPADTSTALTTALPGQSPVELLSVRSPAEEFKEPLRTVANSVLLTEENNSDVQAPPDLTSPPSPAPSPFITLHLTSSTLLSSPVLPSLGLTPLPGYRSDPLRSSSPSAPTLGLPPPHSPSTQALCPPALSPCPSICRLPPSQPPDSPSGQIHLSPELQGEDARRGGAEPATCTTLCGLQLQSSGEPRVLEAEEASEGGAESHITHTLKAAAGGSLVDACCFTGPSGSLRVAAAGSWAVCLWSRSAASDWSLTHTWTFNEPVVNVFPVPDASGLMCVTLGQLEIREVRMLSCCSLTQTLLCEGLIQAVVGVSESRVVTSSPSETGSTLQVFTLSDSNSWLSPRSLVAPGVCVGTLASVDYLSDALIGTDETGHLFVWNLKSGLLLRKIALGDGFSHTACLRGFSHCGVLFVLLQHHFLSSPEKEKEELEEERTAFFSLVAVNPLSGKSVVATRLHPPACWSGRLCEADVNGTSLVGLSQNGCVCVWELGRGGAPPQVLWPPESDVRQLVRWGGADTLVTGLLNGDVTLHRWMSASPCD